MLLPPQSPELKKWSRTASLTALSELKVQRTLPNDHAQICFPAVSWTYVRVKQRKTLDFPYFFSPCLPQLFWEVNTCVHVSKWFNYHATRVLCSTGTGRTNSISDFQQVERLKTDHCLKLWFQRTILYYRRRVTLLPISNTSVWIIWRYLTNIFNINVKLNPFVSISFTFEAGVFVSEGFMFCCGSLTELWSLTILYFMCKTCHIWYWTLSSFLFTV